MQMGQIVKSRKGRDVEMLYVVVGLEENRVQLANGVKRTLEKPKQKNVRHLSQTGTVLAKQQTDTDQSIKTALAAYAKQHGLLQQGG